MKKTLLFSLLFIFLLSIKAQTTELCATDQMHEKLLISNPNYAIKFNANKSAIKNYLNSNQNKSGSKITIPIVVHIIHIGEAIGVGNNISDAQVFSAMDTLNARYSNLHGTSVDTEIEFVLAKRDPNGNPSTGINRINGSVVPNYATKGINANNSDGASEADIKALSVWPNTHYYNVWVISEIDDNNGGFGIQGYAYFPGVSPSIDGTVIMNTCFGSIGTVNSWNNQSRTFVHELGHGLNLYHTFQGDVNGTTCPTGNGDEVSDTDPHIRASSNCPTGVNSCTGNSIDGVTSNFMNYSNQSCALNFTTGQKDRMRAALSVSRPALISSKGATVPASYAKNAVCTPITTNLSNNFGIGITSFSLNNVTVVSSGAVNDGGFVDNSKLQSISVTSGDSYPINVITGNSNDEDVKVYIDYNNNGDLSDLGEEVFSSNQARTHTGNISIPSSGVITGTPLRLRVISDFFVENISGPCYNPNTGQAEDYEIVISSSSNGNVVTTNLHPSSCGETDLDLSMGMIQANPLAGATSYRFRFNGGSLTNEEVIRTSNRLYLGSLSNLASNQTYQVDVAALINGTWTNYDLACSITTEDLSGLDLTLHPEFCGITQIDHKMGFIKFYTRNDASNYRLRFNGVGVSNIEVTTPNNRLYLSQVNGMRYGETYSVEVAAFVRGTWRSYGSICNIATKPLSSVDVKLQPQYCGTSNINHKLGFVQYYQNRAATNYRVRFNGPGVSNVEITTINKRVYLNGVSGMLYGSSYTVDVDAFIDGAWIGYGTSCSFTTMNLSASQSTLHPQYCGATNMHERYSFIQYYQKRGATNYRIRFDGPGVNSFVRETTNQRIYLAGIPGIQKGATYVVDVDVFTDGQWVGYGNTCTITIRPDNQIVNSFIDNTTLNGAQLTIYPNPNSNQRTFIQFNSINKELNEQGQVDIFDVKGRLVFTKKVNIIDGRLYTFFNDDNLLNDGIYFIRVTNSESSITEKLIIQ